MRARSAPPDPVTANRRLESAKRRLVFPLDVATAKEAERLVDELIADVGVFKVGKQLFLAAGPDVVREIVARRGEVFLDLKFHDIPRTVAAAGAQAARLGVRMFDVHASGSGEMMRVTAAEVQRTCRREGIRKPKILAVTVLTSLTADDLREVGVRGRVESQVVRLASLAQTNGMDGVVASPREIASIRAACGRSFTILTPGVRLADMAWDDQKRVATPQAAIRAGADYVVVGKPIRDAASPRDAARAVVADMARGFARGPERVAGGPRSGAR